MRFFATLVTAVQANATLLAFTNQWERDAAVKDAEQLGATLQAVYASELKPAQKHSALPVDSWKDFVKSHDFGHPVKWCDDCRAYTRHENGECVICRDWDYKLFIWVEPNYYGTCDERVRDRTQRDTYYQVRRPNFVHLTDHENGALELETLIEKARENKLTSSVFAVVSHEIMDAPAIQQTLMQNKIADLNIAEVKWYYLNRLSLYLEAFVTPVAPHWKLN